MKIIYLLSIIFFIFGCNLSDSAVDLNGGYEYISEGVDDNFILGHNIIPPNVTSYTQNQEFILAEQSLAKKACINHYSFFLYNRYADYMKSFKNGNSVNSTVVHNEIIPDSILYNIYTEYRVSVNNSEYDIDASYHITDSILSNHPVLRKMFEIQKLYWIIVLKSDSLYGPLTLNEYLEKCYELGIPDKLKIR